MPKYHRVEDFAQSLRAIGEPIRSRTADQISMAKLLTLLFENHGAVRHADPAGTRSPAEDDGGGRRRRPHARPQDRHVGDRRSRWCAPGSSRISDRSASSRTPAERWPCSAALPRGCRDFSARAEAIVAKLAEAADRDFERPSDAAAAFRRRASRPGLSGAACALA